MSPYPLQRVLRWFDLDSQWLRGEEVLAIPLPALRALFRLADDDPMLNVYPIGPDEASRLQAHLEHRIDRDAFSYVVETQQQLPPARGTGTEA
ncbi:MAG: hypothetical protein HC863_02490 [Myxococcales bacterium]|nr:hypothetical protein [Myxococcales bacterium]